MGDELTACLTLTERWFVFFIKCARPHEVLFLFYQNMIFTENKPFFLLNMLPEGATSFSEPATSMVLNLSTTAWKRW